MTTTSHEARVCIHDGRLLSDRRREIRRYSDQQYFKSPEEMREACSPTCPRRWRTPSKWRSAATWS